MGRTACTEPQCLTGVHFTYYYYYYYYDYYYFFFIVSATSEIYTPSKLLKILN
jgi:hypothetical protein